MRGRGRGGGRKTKRGDNAIRKEREGEKGKGEIERMEREKEGESRERDREEYRGNREMGKRMDTRRMRREGREGRIKEQGCRRIKLIWTLSLRARGRALRGRF